MALVSVTHLGIGILVSVIASWENEGRETGKQEKFAEKLCFGDSFWGLQLWLSVSEPKRLLME